MSGLGSSAQGIRSGPRTIEIAGATRRFLLVEPPGQPLGVVLNLHGSSSTAWRQQLLSGMDRLAAAGAVVAFPEGAQRRGRGYVWEPEHDVAFLTGLAESLLRAYPVAPAGVVITGMSGGARMACHLASLRTDLVLAVGAVAGLRAPSRTPLASPVPVIAFHGKADRLNPYAGGGRAEWRESVEEAAAAWAVANGAGPKSEDDLAPGVRRTAYGLPGSPGEVVLLAIDGAGHTWPGGRLGLLGTLFLGRTSRAVDATAAIWRFARDRPAVR